MAGAARGQKALGALPQLMKSLRSEPVSGGARLRRLPSLRYTAASYKAEEMHVAAGVLPVCLLVFDWI